MRANNYSILAVILSLSMSSFVFAAGSGEPMKEDKAKIEKTKKAQEKADRVKKEHAAIKACIDKLKTQLAAWREQRKTACVDENSVACIALKDQKPALIKQFEECSKAVQAPTACSHPLAPSSRPPLPLGRRDNQVDSTRQTALRPGMTEDQIFDSTRQTPAALLRQLYEDHQVLVLSFMEHDNERQYRALNALLDQVGQDPRLKYIVLERFRENMPVLEAASLTSLDETELEQRLIQQYPEDDEGNVRRSLCASEWAYTWAEFMPRIRAINAARPAAHKLVVTTVDGSSASLQAAVGPVSYERDSTTAVLFHDRIWRALQRDKDAKVIALYHIGHTILGFTTPRDGRTIAANFLSMFLRNHPEAKPQTALVMIEGVLPYMQKEFTYELKLTRRQVTRAPGQPFGVRTAPFRSVALERGYSVLTSEERGPCGAGACDEDQGAQSTATLPEMVDGIVWLPGSEQPNTKEGIEYLPKACAFQRVAGQ